MDTKKGGEEPRATSPLMTLVLGPQEIPVVEDPELVEKEQLGGFTSYPSPVITVAPGLSDDVLYSTVLHEFIHALDDAYGVGLSESKTRLLEMVLLQALRDNAGFFTDIIAS